MNVTKLDKIVKWVAYTIEAAMVITIIALSIAVGHKNKVIKQYKDAMNYQSEIVDSLNRTVKDLWSMDCIRVETSCIINNKGLVNVSQTNQISKTIATYTRGECLMALDSLQRVNNQK